VFRQLVLRAQRAIDACAITLNDEMKFMKPVQFDFSYVNGLLDEDWVNIRTESGADPGFLSGGEGEANPYGCYC
jgi:hypothetical protein